MSELQSAPLTAAAETSAVPQPVRVVAITAPLRPVMAVRSEGEPMKMMAGAPQPQRVVAITAPLRPVSAVVVPEEQTLAEATVVPAIPLNKPKPAFVMAITAPVRTVPGRQAKAVTTEAAVPLAEAEIPVLALPVEDERPLAVVPITTRMKPVLVKAAEVQPVAVADLAEAVTVVGGSSSRHRIFTPLVDRHGEDSASPAKTAAGSHTWRSLL